MEGKFRPGHFEGVIEVIKRLLSHVKTNYLFLGKKDYQQLIIIRKKSIKIIKILHFKPICKFLIFVHIQS